MSLFSGIRRRSSFFVYLYYSGQPAAIVQANLFNGWHSGLTAARTIPALRTASPPMQATANLYSTLEKTAR
jgi:hypothetical protein